MTVPPFSPLYGDVLQATHISTRLHYRSLIMRYSNYTREEELASSLVIKKEIDNGPNLANMATIFITF